jgi:hypothetical protein
MPADCPHCAKPIESLPGFVPQAVLEERLKNAKAPLLAENALLKGKVTELEPLAAQATTAAKELESLKTRGARTEAMKAAGVAPDLLEHFETMYASAAAGSEEPVEFGAWLTADTGAKAHPLLKLAFGAPPAAGAPPKPPGVKPPADTGRVPAGSMPKLTPADVQNEIAKLPRGPEHKEAREKRIAELRQQVAAQGG